LFGGTDPLTKAVRSGWVVSALIVVQIVLLAATIGAFAFMLSSLWATLRVTFVGVPESAPEENKAGKRPDARSWRYEYGSRGPVVVHLQRRIRRSAMSGRRRGRRRGRKSRKTGRGDRSGKVTEVRVERSPKGRGKPVKVRIVRRRNGDVTEETYEL
jgi:hypothetical protein